MAELVSKPATYPKNKYWEFADGKIKGSLDIEPIELAKSLLIGVLPFFVATYDALKTESQVLVLTDEDYNRINHEGIPELDPKTYWARKTGLHILVLPQSNSWGLTSVSEEFWHNELSSKEIFPLARIHTHHILDAYQSSTDWSTLNSGSLEIVVGHIYDDVPQIAYWLDTWGSDTKETVWKTVDLGANISVIPSGNPSSKTTLNSTVDKFDGKEKETF